MGVGYIFVYPLQTGTFKEVRVCSCIVSHGSMNLVPASLFSLSHPVEQKLFIEVKNGVEEKIGG